MLLYKTVVFNRVTRNDQHSRENVVNKEKDSEKNFDYSMDHHKTVVRWCR